MKIYLDPSNGRGFGFPYFGITPFGDQLFGFHKSWNGCMIFVSLGLAWHLVRLAVGALLPILFLF